jgi:hypothetical protein
MQAANIKKKDILNSKEIKELVQFSTNFDHLAFDDKIKVCNACAVLMHSRDSLLHE